MNAHPVLLERDGELELLTGVLKDLSKSGGKVVLIRGEAGIGKTSLVKAFLDQNRNRAHVLFGRCDDLLTPRPLDPFWDMARHESALKPPLEEEDRTLLMEAAHDLFDRELRPTLAAIDDTHWADEATLDVISYLGRRIGDTNGLLLLTYRDGEVDLEHPLRRVMGALSPGCLVRIRLRGLSRQAVSSLLAGSARDVDQVLATTNGNPFLVGEMATSEGDRVPLSVQDSVIARLATLTSGARQVLRTLSVIPGQSSLEEIRQLFENAGDALAECEHRGFLVAEDGYVSFRHELIRRAVESSLTGPERVAMNGLILEQLPPEVDPARVAHHAREANDVARLLESAPQAGRAAAETGSHREAVQQFRQLKPHLGRLDPERRCEVLEKWAYEEAFSENGGEAVRLNDLALSYYRDVGDALRESRALLNAAHFNEWMGNRGEAEQNARQALEVLGPYPSQTSLARVFEVRAYLAMMAYNATEAIELADRALELAGPDAEAAFALRCLVHKGTATGILNYEQGKQILDEVLGRAETGGVWREKWRALNNVAELAIDNRDLRTAASYLQTSFEVAPHADAHRKSVHARVLDLVGQWDQAEDLASDASDTGSIVRGLALAVLGGIRARTGRSDSLEALEVSWELAASSTELQRMAPVAQGLAEYAWITDDHRIPVPEIERVMRRALEIGLIWPGGAIAFWLWKLGDLAEIPDGIAEPYRLVIDGEPAEAAKIWEKVGCPYDRAIALAHGDEDDQLEALELLDDLGAIAVAAKLRQELRERGVSIPRGRAKETREHPVGLTPRQDEVLSLLAEGLSNTEIADRLFLSPRTVEHHVSAVLSKLNASTREEAVTIATDIGLLVPS